MSREPTSGCVKLIFTPGKDKFQVNIKSQHDIAAANNKTLVFLYVQALPVAKGFIFTSSFNGLV